MAEEAGPLRVLSVAHPAASHKAGRLRYAPLAADPALVLRLVVPRRWFEFGRWIDAEVDPNSALDVAALPIWLPRAGAAKWYLHVYPGLGAAVRAFRPDVLHLWEEPWSAVALHATRLARRSGAALVLEVDQNILKRLPPPFETIRRHVLARTDLILSRSPDATGVARACGYAGPALPIDYGVDQRTFRPGAPLPAAPLRLGYVGRLVVEKGLDDVIDALARSVGDTRLAVLGEGPHEAKLRDRVLAAGLSARVSFQPWADPAQVADFIRSQHALVLPTRTTADVKEQFGRVIIEAQACGVPVVGSTCGAIPRVIGAGGWVFPERDVAALAALLDRIAADPEGRAARAAAGMGNVAARFTSSAVAAGLLAGWRQAAQMRARGARAPLPHPLIRTAAE